jgi:hypothetical protein
MERLVLTLRPYRKGWLQTLKKMGRERLKEIEALRAQVVKG